MPQDLVFCVAFNVITIAVSCMLQMLAQMRLLYLHIGMYAVVLCRLMQSQQGQHMSLKGLQLLLGSLVACIYDITLVKVAQVDSKHNSSAWLPRMCFDGLGNFSGISVKKDISNSVEVAAAQQEELSC